jgi:hypothetical protein
MLRDNLVGSSSRWLAARELMLSRCAPVSRNRHRTIDPNALKIPAPKGRNLHQRRTSLLHFTLNQDMFPLELAHRTFAAHIECHQYIIETFEQQSKAANYSGLRIERTHSLILEPVDSIEHAMDIAIGAAGEPWVEAKEAKAA